jgi:hypothetical protein
MYDQMTYNRVSRLHDVERRFSSTNGVRKPGFLHAKDETGPLLYT